MMLGGSWVSTGAEASVFARFHFRPHFFQHSGFRLISPNAEAGADAEGCVVKGRGAARHVAEDAGYESRKLLDEYMILHYADDADAMPFGCGPTAALRFPQRCAGLVTEWAEKLGARTDRALDIGCAVGGASFALARTYDEVIGVDLSASFIDAANEMKSMGERHYFRRDQGDLGADRIARIAAEDAAHAGNTTFKRADACALPPDLRGFDAVLMANLLCRLPSPKACLGRLGGPLGLVKPGGLAVIVSPYTWMEQHTPREVRHPPRYRQDLQAGPNPTAQRARCGLVATLTRTASRSTRGTRSSPTQRRAALRCATSRCCGRHHPNYICIDTPSTGFARRRDICLTSAATCHPRRRWS